MPFPKPKVPLATNKMDSIDLFYYRNTYRDEMFTKEDGSLMPTIIDIWYQKHLYGKINSKGDFIIPKQNLVSYLTSKNDETHFALNFVAKAYNEFVRAVDTEKGLANIPSTSHLYNFTVVNGWTSIYDKYDLHMKEVYRQFVNYAYDHGSSDKIKNFDDFVREFFLFADSLISVSKPLTLSGFVMSRDVSNRVSGLMVEIGDKPYSSDKIKYTKYSTDPAFEKYQYLAANHGFLIDKNIPWRLVANLNSCFMKNKLAEEGIYYTPRANISNFVSSIDNPKLKEFQNIVNPAVVSAIYSNWEEVFDVYYFKTYEFDVHYLKAYMELMYDSYIKETPTFKAYIDSSDGGKVKVMKNRKSLDCWSFLYIRVIH